MIGVDWSADNTLITTTPPLSKLSKFSDVVLEEFSKLRNLIDLTNFRREQS
jgi:hypothetical protein